MSARPISNDNNAFIDSELYVQHSGGGPLIGLRFAAKDLFDVSTDLECDAPSCKLPFAIELAAVYTQVSGHVTGYGQPTWRSTHDPAKETTPAVQVSMTAEQSLMHVRSLPLICFSQKRANQG